MPGTANGRCGWQLNNTARLWHLRGHPHAPNCYLAAFSSCPTCLCTPLFGAAHSSGEQAPTQMCRFCKAGVSVKGKRWFLPNLPLSATVPGKPFTYITVDTWFASAPNAELPLGKNDPGLPSGFWTRPMAGPTGLKEGQYLGAPQRPLRSKPRVCSSTLGRVHSHQGVHLKPGSEQSRAIKAQRKDHNILRPQ